MVWLDVPVFNGFGGLPDLREFPGYRGLSGFRKFLLRGNIVDLAVAFVSQVITFVLTAAVVYFVVVLPLHKLLERRASEPAPAVGPPSANC